MRLVPTTLAFATVLLLTSSGADPARLANPPRSPRFAPPASGVMLADDFSGDLHRWQPDRDGVWSLSHGMLRGELPDRKQERSVIYAGLEAWRDYAVDLDACMMRGVDKGIVVRAEGNSGIGVDLRGGIYQDVVMYAGKWPLGKSAVVNANGTWNHIRIEARGSRYTVTVNGELKIVRTDQRREQGRIALPAYTGGAGQCTVYYDNVIVTALGTRDASPGRAPEHPE